MNNNELDLNHEINENVNATASITEDKVAIGVDYKISDATILSVSKNNKGESAAKLTINI